MNLGITEVTLISPVLSLLLGTQVGSPALPHEITPSEVVKSRSELASAGQGELTPSGRLIEKVVCRADTVQSYSLYLPAKYTPERKWPVLYAFDPAARGSIPVERFKLAAEEYG
ncbi:MAG: hypothetical protein ACREBG_00385 [Pyrinomonadaceae bacterium]